MPGGPPPQCKISEIQRDHFQFGLGVGSFSTTLRFDGEQEVAVEMTTVSLAGAWFIDDTWTVRAGVGAILDGELTPETNTPHDVEPGALMAIGVAYRALSGEGYTPFVDLSFFLGGSWTQTVDPDSDFKTSYSAADARLGARAGWNLQGNLFPYAAVRLFGGPVNWELAGEDVGGTDIHHYQLALGAAAQVGPMGVHVEWAGLGEQALSAGVSTAW